MQEITLDVAMREQKTKGALKKYRQTGKIPSVIYGAGEKNVLGLIDQKYFEKILQQTSLGNTIFNLKLAHGEKKAIIKDIQIDIVRRNPIHVDFQVVSMTSMVEVSVPVKIIGEAPGVKLHGGILEHFIREIKVKCLPKNIPPSIDVEISSLEIGNSITVAQLPRYEGVEYRAEPQSIVVNVVAPMKEEVAAPAEPGTVTAEPEVISKGKKEEIEEVAPPEKK